MHFVFDLQSAATRHGITSRQDPRSISMTSRREFLGSASAFAAATLLAAALPGVAHGAAPAMLRRPIPSSGETIPVIGMGTSGSFEVSPSSAEFQSLREV